MGESVSEALHLPRAFGALPGYGGRGLGRYPWRRPAQVMAPARGWCCQCVDDDDLDGWDEAVAPFILREPEWRAWRRIANAATRHRWIRGRVAAKDAVRLLLWERFGGMATLEAIEILADERGRPRVSCVALPETGAGVSVSISHCGTCSVAFAAECSPACQGVGFDVAAQADDHDGLAEGGFGSAETALLDDCPLAERSDWLLRLWCAKEAAGKALGVGLLGNPLNFVVRRIDRERETVVVESGPAPGTGGASDGPTRLTAHVGCDRNLAFAVAWLEAS